MSSRVQVDQYFDVISIMLVVFDEFPSFNSEYHYLIPETLSSNFLTGVLSLEDKEKSCINCSREQKCSSCDRT